MKLLKSLFVVGLSLFHLGGTTGSSVQALESTESAVKAAEMEKIKQLTEQIKLDPKKALLYAKRGQCYVRLKDWSNALADTNAAIGLNSTCPPYYVARADVFNAMGKHELEKADLEKAVILGPNDAESLKWLAVCYSADKRFSEASSLFSRAIAQKPQSVELYLFRAETFVAQKDFTKAVSDCNVAFKLEPGNKKTIMVMNEIKAAQGK